MTWLRPCLLLLALFAACSDENGGEDDICSNENVVDDVDDGTLPDANGAY